MTATKEDSRDPRDKRTEESSETESKHVAEVHVFEIGHVQESLLDTNTLSGLTVGSGDIEPSILAKLFLFLLGRGGGKGRITSQVTAVEEPAEEEDQEGLAAVRSEDDGPRNAGTGLVFVAPPLR